MPTGSGSGDDQWAVPALADLNRSSTLPPCRMSCKDASCERPATKDFASLDHVKHRELVHSTLVRQSKDPAQRHVLCRVTKKTREEVLLAKCEQYESETTAAAITFVEVLVTMERKNWRARKTAPFVWSNVPLCVLLVRASSYGR